MISAKVSFLRRFHAYLSPAITKRASISSERLPLERIFYRRCARVCNWKRDRQLYPKIARQEIREPLFIVGLPRSGTTLLHNLLAADPSIARLSCGRCRRRLHRLLRNEKRRIRRAARSCDFFNWLAPTFRYVHAVGAELPQECIGLMTPTFMSDQFDAMYMCHHIAPGFFGRIYGPAYQYLARFLQHLQFRHATIVGS